MNDDTAMKVAVAVVVWIMVLITILVVAGLYAWLG